jgi:hypothetical protein
MNPIILRDDKFKTIEIYNSSAYLTTYFFTYNQAYHHQYIYQEINKNFEVIWTKVFFTSEEYFNYRYPKV